MSLNSQILGAGMRSILILTALGLTQPALANDWERFYRPVPTNGNTVPSDAEPEMISSSGNLDNDLDQMWRKGFAPIGYTSFNTTNNKTDDGVRLAKRLKARYLIVGVNFLSSQTASMPLTLPQATTSYSNGNVSAYGSGGYANGTYSGTTTTYGTQTTYIPITINRFIKQAIYFQEVLKSGMGVYNRPLNDEEMRQYQTRHAVVVRFVRDGSPAYVADILPGDIITKVNGQPFDPATVRGIEKGPQPIAVHLIRGGQDHDVQVTIPPDWQPK